jgi:hypothetical protein
MCDSEWEPKAGWNVMFSEQHRIEGADLFFFLKNKKGFSDKAAKIMVQMSLFKQIYPGLRYSKEQEAMLLSALRR